MSNKEKQKEEELLRKCRQILGVSPNATSQEIKKAYHNLAQQWHPDKFVKKTDEEKSKANERMQEINQANDYLCGKFNGHNLFGNHDNANVNETDLTKSRNSETNWNHSSHYYPNPEFTPTPNYSNVFSDYDWEKWEEKWERADQAFAENIRNWYNSLSYEEQIERAKKFIKDLEEELDKLVDEKEKRGILKQIDDFKEAIAELQEKIIIRLKSEIQQLREELLKNLSNKEEIVKIIAEKEVKIKELESEIDNYYKSLNPERLSDEIKKTKRELESLKNDKDAKNSELKSELEKKLQKLEKTKSINVDSNCLNKPKNKELPIRLIVGWGGILMVLLIIVIVIKKKFTNYLIKLAKFNKKSGYKQRITSKK